MFYIKNEKEIWIAEENFTSNGALLVTLCEAYYKLQGIEKSSPQYLEKFEKVVTFYL